MPLCKTPLAHACLQQPRGTLNLRQRRALILADGQRDHTQLCRLLGAEAPALLQQLCDAGYLDDPDRAAAAARAPVSAQSLVAARLYLLDILQLQRSAQARGWEQALRQARDDDAGLLLLVHTLHQLATLTRPSYVQRVGQQLRQLLPASQHGRFDQLRAPAGNIAARPSQQAW